MTNRPTTRTRVQTIALTLLATMPLAACAQAPVDDSGRVIGTYESASVEPYADLTVGNEEIPLMSDIDLEVLVGPIALYPDDLLAIVLPASAYPLQLVDAARFLEEHESNPSLKPDPEWDDSVVALLNYPEVIDLLNEDIDWTWRLGEAVVSQQGDVVSAIEIFRDRAYAAGNLKSDSYQDVTRDEGVIEISPVVEDVIYVPYYEPERVVIYQPRPVYYYYPRSYPVYYYPYSSAYQFDRGYFWGVTTAFTIGWMSDSLNVYHHSYRGHPYYGRSYRDRWWYRRPTMNVYNTTYVRNTNVTVNRYNNGDRWRARQDRHEYSRDYSRQHAREDYRRDVRVTQNRDYKQHVAERKNRAQPARRQEPIEFRDRTARRNNATQQRNTQRHDVRQREDRRETTVARAERKTAPATRQAQARRQPVVRQPREQADAQRQARQQPRERATPQRQARQQPREQAAPQRQARQQPREQAAPQRQARQQPREQAAPQRQARQQPRERAAPQRQEKREARGESRGSEKRNGDASAQRNRKARR